MNLDYQRPPLRVALMGLGRAMFSSHYSVYKAHPSLFKIVAACDVLKERRDLLAAELPDCKMFRQFQDMLDEKEIDLVDIATCSVDHVSHAMMSLERGFWTLLETPIALNYDDANRLRAAAIKARNHLLVLHRGIFSPDFLLTKQMMNETRLGEIYELRVRKEDYIRRDDWQTVKRCGGGAAFYAMIDLIMQTLLLLPTAPIQMWSELKRIASLGDAEDFAHLCLKTRTSISANIEYNGGCLPNMRSPAFEIRAERGTFSVSPGANEGVLTLIDPAKKFSHRRASVRSPGSEQMYEEIPTIQETVKLSPGTKIGPSVFWSHVYNTVRTATPFPWRLDDSIEAFKFAHLMKKTSPFGV